MVSASAKGHPSPPEVHCSRAAAGAVGVRMLSPSHDSPWANIFKGSLVPECRGRSLSGIIGVVKEVGKSHGFLQTFLKVPVGAALSAHEHLEAFKTCPVSL